MEIEKLEKILPVEKFKSWFYDYQLSMQAISSRIGVSTQNIAKLKQHYIQQGHEFPDKLFN